MLHIYIKIQGKRFLGLEATDRNLFREQSCLLMVASCELGLEASHSAVRTQHTCDQGDLGAR